jgi:CarD family transcriptional regulator
LAHLKQSETPAKDWKQRARDNSRRLTSGSAMDLVEVIGSLTELSETKQLSFRESGMLNKARRLLVTEISEVLKETRAAADNQVGEALKGLRLAKI